MRHGLGLRLLERLQYRRRQPRMLFGKRPPHANQMPDRENLGALVVILGSGDGVAEQPADVLVLDRGRSWRHKTVDLAIDEHLRNGLAPRRACEPNAAWTVG